MGAAGWLIDVKVRGLSRECDGPSKVASGTGLSRYEGDTHLGEIQGEVVLPGQSSMPEQSSACRSSLGYLSSLGSLKHHAVLPASLQSAHQLSILCYSIGNNCHKVNKVNIEW